jgi:4-hydroxybenzoate polyprenyltransferase
MWHKLKTTLQMIKFEHTIFALPFAFIAALLAGGGLPTLRQTVWILAAMVGARSAAMTFNRIADFRFDKLNPRTSGRALPRGSLSMRFAVMFTVAMSLLFIIPAWQLNPVCLYLSFPTLAILFLIPIPSGSLRSVIWRSVSLSAVLRWLPGWQSAGSLHWSRCFSAQQSCSG